MRGVAMRGVEMRGVAMRAVAMRGVEMGCTHILTPDGVLRACEGVRRWEFARRVGLAARTELGQIVRHGEAPLAELGRGPGRVGRERGRHKLGEPE
eukprot:639830-Pleurochrysis_carterae.AAC.1